MNALHPTQNDLLIVLAALGTALGIRLVVSLLLRLRAERAVQRPNERSPVWILIAFGIVAYLMAYFAFDGELQMPIRLAFIGMGISTIPMIRRLMC